jgi:hypothetical protein
LFDNENYVYVVLDAVPGIALIGYVKRKEKLFSPFIFNPFKTLSFSRKQYQEQVIYESKMPSSGLTVSTVSPESNSPTSTAASPIQNESDIGPEIVHEYKVINKGPSQILASELLITWQKYIKMDTSFKEYLYLMDNPFLQGQIKCQLSSNLVNPLNLSVSVLRFKIKLLDLLSYFEKSL